MYKVGEVNYELCVQELLGDKSDVLKDLREYARYGKGPYWQYNQRRIYSEGACFVHKDDKESYEILHEMMFFTKEHKRYSTGQVEAEIYFVMAVAGIEYAMCISDQSIAEYQKWIVEHDGFSPLNDDDEILLREKLCGKDEEKREKT